MPFGGDTPQQFSIRLRRIYVLYTAGFALMILLMALAEILGLPRNWIGYVFLLVTVSLYAGIGIVCRTSDQVEYYVAGRRVPAFYNGMATAADWMSVASFIGVAGTLYLTGYGGLAYIMGWTGGYVLVAMLLAPYLRRFGQYTIPDFMGARYGGNLPRLAGVACAILCSFTYLVAQIYGVGIITTRMTGISFELGIFVALGGMLVCSFLGGMRAVTWTQVGQYIILVIAYLVPVVWLSIKHTDMPVPQLSAGAVLQQVTEKEVYLQNDPAEIEVRRLWQERADEMAQRVRDLPESWALEKDKLRSRLAQLNAGDAPMVEIRSVERELAAFPPNVEEARIAWSQAKATFEARAAPLTPHAEPFPSEDPEERRNMRINFLALVLCLMLGTAGMPHILMRSYTTSSVIEARRSVCWSLLFILLLILLAAQAVYVYRGGIARMVPALRPVLERACEPLHCRVPYAREIDRLAITGSALKAADTDVPSGPAPGAQDTAEQHFVLHATLRNQAELPQEWPTLVLDLKDVAGTLLVRRNLAPADYLGPSRAAEPFAARSEVLVRVPLTLSGVRINGYQLDLFYP